MIALQIVGGWVGIGALVSLAAMVIDRVVKPNDVPLFNWWGYAFFVVFWPGLILLIWRTLYAPRPTCAYCGAKCESMDEVPAHLAVCEKHPMRELEAEIERLRVQLREELEERADAAQSWRDMAKTHEKQIKRIQARLRGED